MKTPAADATEPIAVTDATSWTTSTSHTTAMPSTGSLPNRSIIPSPVATVYQPPAKPMTNLRNTPTITTQSTPVPRMAPVRVARITSPEPMYSEHQTIDGPIANSSPKPTGGAATRSLSAVGEGGGNKAATRWRSEETGERRIMIAAALQDAIGRRYFEYPAESFRLALRPALDRKLLLHVRGVLIEVPLHLL